MKKFKLKVSIVCILTLMCACIIPSKIFADSMNKESTVKQDIVNVELTQEDKSNIEDEQVNNELVKEEQDDMIELNLKGNMIKFNLPEDQTTGSHWYYEIKDESIATVVSQGYSFNPHVEEVVGQTKVHTWTIAVLKQGITEVTFTLKRPLNKDIVYDTKTYKIDASDVNNVKVIGNSFYDEATGKYIENCDNLNKILLKNNREYIESIIGEIPDAIIGETCFDEVDVKKGDIVAIKLKEVPGSEYRWHYYIDNDDILDFIDDGGDLKGNKLLLNGSVINHYWGFEAVSEGKTTVNFKLYKDSNGEKNLIRVYKFTINVTSEEENEEVLPYESVSSVAVK